MSETKPSIKKNFFLNTVYQILTIITPFITAPYLARVLGVDNIGISSYSYSIVSYFTMFAALGTYTYGIREISRTREKKELNSKIFWEIQTLKCFTSSIVLIIWAFTVIFFSKELKIIFLILTFPILSAMFDISWFYIGLEQFKFTVTRNCIVKIIGVILIITLVKCPSHLWLFILINSLTGFLGNLSMWFTLKRFLVPVNFKNLNIRPHFKETIVYFIPTIASSIYHILDKTLIGIITKEPSQNGYYEEAVKIINLVKSLCYSSISGVMETRNNFLYENNELDEFKSNINKTIDFIMFMSIGSCFGLIGIANIFMPTFLGESFRPSALLLMLLSPTLIIIGISVCGNSLYYIPAGQKKKSCFFEIYGALLNLICNLILIPQLKSVGAIIGTLLAETLIATLYISFSKGYITFKNIFLYSYKKFIAAAIMLLYLIIISKLQINVWFILSLQIIGGIIIYCVILLILKDGYTFKLFLKLKNKILSLLK